MANDEVLAAFYDRHPYPPPVTRLDDVAVGWDDGARRRVEHHLIWPSRPFRADIAILVAGCGTSQAARYAIRHPNARVVGIDVSRTSIEHTRSLAERHRLDNLTVHRLPITEVSNLNTSFDHIVSTGVLHHLASPDEGLRALSDVLVPHGAMTLMLYAPYGRTGVYLIQEYCRRLGVGTSPEEIADLVTTLRELPLGHPLSHRLRNTPDFQDADAIADALLHPRDRSYSVPEVFEFLRRGGLELDRWLRQAPYLPRCGSLSAVPHGARIRELPIEEQYAAVELFRGTMVRHTFVASQAGRRAGAAVRFDGDEWPGYVPLVPHTVTSVRERLPEGAAAALLNQAHEFTDLVMFVDERELAMFEAIDGRRPIGAIAGAEPAFFERLWEHDLVVVDASAKPQTIR